MKIFQINSKTSMFFFSQKNSFEQPKYSQDTCCKIIRISYLLAVRTICTYFSPTLSGLCYYANGQTFWLKSFVTTSAEKHRVFGLDVCSATSIWPKPKGGGIRIRIRIRPVGVAAPLSCEYDYGHEPGTLPS